jgi:hypothetical protein
VPPLNTSWAARTPFAAEARILAAAYHLHTSTAQAQHHTRRDTPDDRSSFSQAERGAVLCGCDGVRRRCCRCDDGGGGDGRRARSCGDWSSSGWLAVSGALRALLE